MARSGRRHLRRGSGAHRTWSCRRHRRRRLALGLLHAVVRQVGDDDGGAAHPLASAAEDVDALGFDDAPGDVHHTEHGQLAEGVVHVEHVGDRPLLGEADGSVGEHRVHVLGSEELRAEHHDDEGDDLEHRQPLRPRAVIQPPRTEGDGSQGQGDDQLLDEQLVDGVLDGLEAQQRFVVLSERTALALVLEPVHHRRSEDDQGGERPEHDRQDCRVLVLAVGVHIAVPSRDVAGLMVGRTCSTRKRAP